MDPPADSRFDMEAARKGVRGLQGVACPFLTQHLNPNPNTNPIPPPPRPKQEFKNAVKLFEGDPYGCHSPLLQQKRLERNPFRCAWRDVGWGDAWMPPATRSVPD